MKNNKGITLVSLIVTIIVMVILAGIALLFSVGEGGIIERSQKAEVEQLLAKEKELVELAISDAKITTRNSVLTGNILTQALKNQDLEPDRELSEKAPFIFKIKDGTGKTYIVLENGEINAIDTDGEIDEEYLVNIAIETAKKNEGGLTGTNLTNALNELGLEPDRELSETAPFIFKIKDGTGKEYVVMDDGTIGATEGNAKDWKYNTLSDGTISITKCLLTDLNNITIPKYLIDENGNKLTVTGLGNNNIIYNDQGSVNDNIGEFTGTLILPNDVTIYRYAFYNCPDVEKVIVGDNTKFHNLCSYRQFNSNNLKLKEVKIGKDTIAKGYIFYKCPNIEKIIVEDNVILGNSTFLGSSVRKIKIKNNVTAQSGAFYKIQNEIEKIEIGDNFISEGTWLTYCTVKDIEIGSNASFADNGLMAQYNVTITGTVTINGELKKIGAYTLKGCTIKTPNNYLKVPENEEIGAAALHSIKGIEKIILGKNSIFKYNGTVFVRTDHNVYIESEGPITVSGAIFAGNTILPSKLEFSGQSIIDTTFYYLSDTNKNSLKEIVLNPGATVTNLGTYPKDLKIILKNISEWDSELLESNKAVIEAFGLTKYEVIDENGVYTK